MLALDSQKLLYTESFWESLNKVEPFPVLDETLNRLNGLTEKYPLSEISTFKRLHDMLNERDVVYLGNSLVIRFFELTQTKVLEVHGNRGVNGIDGQLASAIGLAMGTIRPVTCILGDVTTFYDLSSLREMPDNLNLIIMNNKGGRIFDMLKLDKRIVMEHDQDFKDIARGLKLSYGTSLSDFGKVKVLELSPSREQTEALMKEWQQ